MWHAVHCRKILWNLCKSSTLNIEQINMSNTIFSSHLVHFSTNHPPCHQNFSYLSLYLQHTILVEHKKYWNLNIFSANESHVVIPIIVAILVFPILVIASICFVRSPLTSVNGLSSWSILFLNFISHQHLWDYPVDDDLVLNVSNMITL